MNTSTIRIQLYLHDEHNYTVMYNASLQISVTHLHNLYSMNTFDQKIGLSGYNISSFQLCKPINLKNLYQYYGQ